MQGNAVLEKDVETAYCHLRIYVFKVLLLEMCIAEQIAWPLYSSMSGSLVDLLAT